MRVAIMQPYLFPYLAYYQLIYAVDIFVIYDDVNYIKKGWINRNRILVNGSEHMFNILLKGGGSSNKKINEIEIETERNLSKLLKTIEQAYKKAPCFAEVYPLFTNILSNKEPNLAKYLTSSLNSIITYLDIQVSVVVSSEIQKNTSLKGIDKVIDICKQLKATNYINAIGGQELYSKEIFVENGINLNFIKSKPVVYPQFKNQFIPWLSIIDVMMFNSVEKIQEMLDNYELI
jgi:hypothetical protein